MSYRGWLLLSAETRAGPSFRRVPPASLHLQPDASRHRQASRLSARGRPDVHLPGGREVQLRGLSDQHHWVYHISVAHTNRRTGQAAATLERPTRIRGAASLDEVWFHTLATVGLARQRCVITRFCQFRRWPCACGLTAIAHWGYTKDSYKRVKYFWQYISLWTS